MELTEQDIIEYYESNSDSDFAAVYEAVGAKATLELVTIHSGCTIYVPVLDKIIKQKRDRLIRQGFYENGLTITKLAKLYNITTRTIYSILKKK